MLNSRRAELDKAGEVGEAFIVLRHDAKDKLRLGVNIEYSQWRADEVEIARKLRNALVVILGADMIPIVQAAAQWEPKDDLTEGQRICNIIWQKRECAHQVFYRPARKKMLAIHNKCSS